MSTFSCQLFCVDRCPFIVIVALLRLVDKDAFLFFFFYSIQLTGRLINIVWENHILKAHSSQFIAVWNSFWIALAHFLHSFFAHFVLVVQFYTSLRFFSSNSHSFCTHSINYLSSVISYQYYLTNCFGFLWDWKNFICRNKQVICNQWISICFLPMNSN